MSLMLRNGRPYLYCSRRVGDRVIREYLGTGQVTVLGAEQITLDVRPTSVSKDCSS